MLTDVTLTYLEIKKGEEIIPPPGGFRSEAYKLVLAGSISPAFNKMMYNAVGADWAWTDKSDWTHKQWMDYILDNTIVTYYVTCDGTPCGYTEVSYSKTDRSANISYFGLVKQYIGCGFGGWMLHDVLFKVLSRDDIDRVWLYTSSTDHDNALKNYLARGMKIYKTEVVKKDL